ncbi:hypothetical protein B0H19DRAFT_1321889 [Mycena capillaripes]|nr:hypothetical protein B0H19DRAFT_1321889 [Mycena capillaripes]
MPGRTVQYQVKLAAMNLFERDILPLQDILDIVGFSESTFWRVRKLWHETGWVEKPKSEICGRRRLLHRDDLDYIRGSQSRRLRRDYGRRFENDYELIKVLVKLRPDWFLDEMLNLLKHNRFISVHFTTIFRELERLGMSRKKLKKIASERNEAVRLDFVRRMAGYPAEYLGFLDETSKNDRTYSHGMMANRVVEGSMKRADYLDFIEHEVVHAPDNTLSWSIVGPGDGQCSYPSWRGNPRASRAFW